MAVKFLTGVDLSNQRAINVADPSGNTDGANKQYVDNKVAGLAWKDEVRVATTTNGALASAYANGSSLDGLTLATGDRILIKDQTTQTENGIYTVNVSGAPTRATDADSTADLNNATVSVTDGTVNAGKSYTQTTKNPTVGSSNIVWAIFAAGTTYTAGNGLTGTTTFSVLANGTSIDVSASGVKIADAAGGAGLTVSAGILAVGAGTGVTVAADTVSVDTSIVNRRFSQAIGDGVATAITVTHSFGHRALTVQVWETATPWTQVFPDVTLPATTTATFTFAVAPTSSQYTVVISG